MRSTAIRASSARADGARTARVDGHRIAGSRWQLIRDDSNPRRARSTRADRRASVERSRSADVLIAGATMRTSRCGQASSRACGRHAGHGRQGCVAAGVAGGVAARRRRHARHDGAGVELVGRAALGAGLIRLDGDVAAQPTSSRRCDRATAPAVRHVVVLRRHAPCETRVDVWGRSAIAAVAGASVKHAFDPQAYSERGHGTSLSSASDRCLMSCRRRHGASTSDRAARRRSSTRACTAASACRRARRYLLWGEEMDSPRGRIYLMKAGLEGRARR